MSSRVVLLSNPASGRGKAERFAHALTAALVSDNWDVDHRAVGDHGDQAGFDGARAIVVIGGDGTAHRAATTIASSGVPMVLAPMGTENLLANELGFDAEIIAICNVIRGGKLSHIDLPSVNGDSFLIMCSVGLDAAIVAEVEAKRTGSIRKSAYLMPVLRQALRPTMPELRVTVDGKVVADRQRGMLVVANCRRYGARLNPANDASMTDGLLDVAFFPIRHTFDAIRWAMLSRTGRHTDAQGFIKARGRLIDVENLGDTISPVQIDGESAHDGLTVPLRFIADAGKLGVLRSIAQ